MCVLVGDCEFNLEQVLEIIKSKTPLMHLILAGRDAHPQVVGPANTVSEVNTLFTKR